MKGNGATDSELTRLVMGLGLDHGGNPTARMTKVQHKAQLSTGINTLSTDTSRTTLRWNVPISWGN